jgi:uncharacterized protein YecA (UPF0149 family)
VFYHHTLPRFRKLAEEIIHERRKTAAMGPGPQSGRAPGRNDPCPCGSGRKYKKCCGRAG